MTTEIRNKRYFNIQLDCEKKYSMVSPIFMWYERDFYLISFSVLSWMNMK